MDYSPGGSKESDTIERLSAHRHTHTHTHTRSHFSSGAEDQTISFPSIRKNILKKYIKKKNRERKLPSLLIHFSKHIPFLSETHTFFALKKSLHFSIYFFIFFFLLGSQGHLSPLLCFNSGSCILGIILSTPPK